MAHEINRKGSDAAAQRARANHDVNRRYYPINKIIDGVVYYVPAYRGKEIYGDNTLVSDFDYAVLVSKRYEQELKWDCGSQYSDSDGGSWWD